MKIAMFTNTFSPHIGGVAYSVAWLAQDICARGHQVLIVAPEFEGAPPAEPDVIRVPALQNFRGSDFSVPIVLSRSINAGIERFAPDIVHSHHPFLLGGTALRVSAALDLPVIYTYHTRYELYSHYVSQDSPTLKRLALNLALGYCDLCDAVVAPSESIASFLAGQGVSTPVTVIPTGIDPLKFKNGDGAGLRAELGISSDAFVVGHVGRLAQEKNLEFLTQALVDFITGNSCAHFVVAGQGALADSMQSAFDAANCANRLHLLGAVTGTRLADAYACMDIFAFSSQSETQGLVLAEAMSAGVPVVALDAPGAREIVTDVRNGRLMPEAATAQQFSGALDWMATLPAGARTSMRKAACKTSARFSHKISTQRMLDLYQARLKIRPASKQTRNSLWRTTKREIEGEWKIFRNVAHAVGDAVITSVLPGNN